MAQDQSALPFVYKETVSGEGSFTCPGDAYAFDADRHIYAVADAPFRRITVELRRYPHDDHGMTTSMLFCEGFVEEVGKVLERNGTFSERAFHDVLKNVNKRIRELNERLEKTYRDPLAYDVAETVGMGMVVYDGTLYYGGLEDCYVNVLRGDSFDNIAPLDFQIMKAARHIKQLTEQGKIEAMIPDGLRGKLSDESLSESVWCGALRNNSEVTDENGEKVGWGCFTGEQEAEAFFQVHSLKLEKNDRVLLFSDGMVPVLSNDEFLGWYFDHVSHRGTFQHEMRKKIMELLKGTEDVNKEKTLLYPANV
ncbi:MAG: hypothetical protein PHG63_02755 [Candidatus Dojkabacteria bacterium]|nr:hypothetical protein [Candidatus Dojkabacteria bacterium]